MLSYVPICISISEVPTSFLILLTANNLKIIQTNCSSYNIIPKWDLNLKLQTSFLRNRAQKFNVIIRLLRPKCPKICRRHFTWVNNKLINKLKR